MPYDTEHTFEETMEQHATRLGQTRRWTKIRRRALLLKLDGLTPAQVQARMGGSNCPEDLAHAGVEDLLAALAVTLAGGQPALVPDPEAPLPHLSGFENSRRTLGQHDGHLSDKEGLARAGVLLGQPYGYTRRGGRIVVVPREAEVVRFLFDRYIQGWSFPEIAADLNRRGVLTRSGRPWSADTLRDMLRNPVYAGYVLYRGAEDRNRRDAGVLYPGQQEAIVSWETFCQAQDARVRRDPRDPKPFWTCPWKNAPRQRGEEQ